MIDMVYLDGVCEWGAITAFRCKDTKIRLICGCRFFTLAEARKHWDKRKDRPRTKLALALIEKLLKKKASAKE